MEITWLGVLLIPLSLLLLVVAPIWLYRASVFSIPFTATSLLNGASGAPLTPINLFGTLFFAVGLLALMMKPRKLRRHKDRSMLLLFMFLGVVVLSMVMPFIIDGSLWVSSNRLYDLYEEPLRLTTKNIWAPFPVIFYVILSVFWIFNNNTQEKMRSTIKIYVLSGVFVSLWGIFQFVCSSVLRIEYPYYIFNNAVVDSMKGYTQTLEINGLEFSRISSVTHEPSILSKYLLTVVPIMVVCVLMRQPLFSRGWDKIALAILVFALAITISSTAYIGIIFVMGVTLAILKRFYSVGRKWTVLLAFGGIIAGLAYLRFPAVREILNLMVFAKSESGSALERYLSIITSWEYFLEYPVLGIGWSMVTSHDLLVYMLVSTGVVGLATFVVLIFYVIRRSLITLGRTSLTGNGQNNDMFVMVAGLTISLVTLIFTGLLTGIEFYLGYFYFVLSMLIASNTLVERETSSSITTARPIPVQGDS